MRSLRSSHRQRSCRAVTRAAMLLLIGANSGGFGLTFAQAAVLSSGRSDQLKFGTFLGGSENDAYNAVRSARGTDGSIYLVGTTFSPDFPTTPGALDPSYNGDGDV